MEASTGRAARKMRDPDLGILASRLLSDFQGELFTQLAARGFTDLKPRHGGVLAYLDSEGLRVGDFVALSGRSKQTVGAILDELEVLDYLQRARDPKDRRARLIVATARGVAATQAADEITADLEAGPRRILGDETYGELKGHLCRLLGMKQPA